MWLIAFFQRNVMKYTN